MRDSIAAIIGLDLNRWYYPSLVLFFILTHSKKYFNYLHDYEVSINIYHLPSN